MLTNKKTTEKWSKALREAANKEYTLTGIPFPPEHTSLCSAWSSKPKTSSSSAKERTRRWTWLEPHGKMNNHASEPRWRTQWWTYDGIQYPVPEQMSLMLKMNKEAYGGWNGEWKRSSEDPDVSARRSVGNLNPTDTPAEVSWRWWGLWLDNCATSYFLWGSMRLATGCSSYRRSHTHKHTSFFLHSQTSRSWKKKKETGGISIPSDWNNVRVTYLQMQK